MRTLSKREKDVLGWLYGVGDKPKMTDKELAVHLGVKEERIHEIATRAVERALNLSAQCDAFSLIEDGFRLLLEMLDRLPRNEDDEDSDE